MKVAVLAVLATLVTVLSAQYHHRNRQQGGYRHQQRDPYEYNYDRYHVESSNVVPSGPNQGEAGLPGLPGLQGPPGPPGRCDCPVIDPVPCGREGVVHMFQYYHDMAGSNIGIGSMAFVTNTNDMWLNTEDGWKKIGWIQ